MSSEVSTSSTPSPSHVAVIMDGNGRWAQQRGKPRGMGHQAGVKSARAIVRAAYQAGVKSLTLFAFSSENWQRPEAEVGLLMNLFISTLGREIARLNKNDIRLVFIGDRSAFPEKLQQLMDKAERTTHTNAGLNLLVAVGYGGQWDIVQAVKKLVAAGKEVDAQAISSNLSTAEFGDPELLIRTGGESRVSNFLLWQAAYAELYFTNVLWPDFSANEFLKALTWYGERNRRFGRITEGNE